MSPENELDRDLLDEIDQLKKRVAELESECANAKGPSAIEQALRASEERLRLALDAGRMGIWDWDTRSGNLRWSDTLEPLHGLKSGSFGGTFEAFIEAVYPDDREDVVRSVQRALETGGYYETEFRVVWPDGSIRWISGQGQSLRDEHGNPTRMIGVGTDITARKQVEEELREIQKRLSLLVEVSGTLLSSPELERVVPRILDVAGQVIQADAYAVWRQDALGSVWTVVASSGLSETFQKTVGASRRQDSILEAPLVVDDIEHVATLAERREAYRAEGIRSLLVVPLRVHGRTSGTISFYCRTPHSFTQTEVRIASALANLAASAIGTAEIYERQRQIRIEAEKAERRSTFLADATAILASSLDYETTLASIARLAVPHIADWCAVDIVASDGSLKQLALEHVNPERAAWACELQRRVPLDPNARHGVPQVIRTGRSEIVAEVPDSLLVETAIDEDHLRMLREAAFSSFMCVPLVARGRTLGAISFITAESGRHYGANDLAFAEDLARRAAFAVDNARLFTVAHRDRNAAETALHALRQSEARFRRLVDSGIIGIILGDSDRIFEANDVFLDMLGYSREDLSSGKVTWPALTRPEFRPLAVRAREDPRSKGAFAPFEDEFIRKDGSRVPVLLGGAVLEESAQLTWVCFVLDLTERKRLEEKLRDSQRLESIGLLAGGIAHDFNNLLTGIMGNASLALDDLPPTHPASRPVQMVIRASERAADLTRQLLAYSGKGRFIIQPVNISDLVRDIAHLLQSSIPKKVSLVMDLEDDLPPVEADSGQIQQLVMNLVINGAEAIGEDRGTLYLSTRTLDVAEGYSANPLVHDELAPGRYIALIVRDTGCGMDEETRSRIFDPFFTTKFTGRGLGLAAALGIVRGHRGDIRVLSAPGQGSTFTVLFPAAWPMHREPVAELPESILTGTGTILVVDDEAIVRETAKAALEKYGYSVLLAEDGRRGLDIFAELAEKIALVLLDMTMPVMGGEETFKEMKSIRPDVRVIVTSGYNEVEAIRKFTTTGVAGFIQKPYPSKRLAEQVKAVLDGRNTVTVTGPA